MSFDELWGVSYRGEGPLEPLCPAKSAASLQPSPHLTCSLQPSPQPAAKSAAAKSAATKSAAKPGAKSAACSAVESIGTSVARRPSVGKSASHALCEAKGRHVVHTRTKSVRRRLTLSRTCTLLKCKSDNIFENR